MAFFVCLFGPISNDLVSKFVPKGGFPDDFFHSPLKLSILPFLHPIFLLLGFLYLKYAPEFSRSSKFTLLTVTWIGCLTVPLPIL